jgi:hypothetical protein
MIEEKCPHCNRDAITYRIKAGEKNFICGAGHNWTSAEAVNKRLADAQKQTKKTYWP